MTVATLRLPLGSADASHRETDENYTGELFREGSYRVAVCKDGIQWLFQRQSHATSPAGPRWQSLGYCTTREALARLWTGAVGTEHPDLGNLSDRIMRRAG